MIPFWRRLFGSHAEPEPVLPKAPHWAEEVLEKLHELRDRTNETALAHERQLHLTAQALAHVDRMSTRVDKELEKGA